MKRKVLPVVALVVVLLALFSAIAGSASWDFRQSYTHFDGTFTYSPIYFSPRGCYQCTYFPPECDQCSCGPKFDHVYVEWEVTQISSGQTQSGSRTLDLGSGAYFNLYLTGSPRCSLALVDDTSNWNRVKMTSISCYPYAVDLELTWWDDHPFGDGG